MDNASLPKTLNEIIPLLGERIGAVIKSLPETALKGLHEIRLRSESPLMITVKGQPFFVTESGQTCILTRAGLFTVKKQEVEQCFKAGCGYSLHTHQHEIADGFVVMRGGHRAGIAGTAVTEKGSVTSFRDITSLNLRVARQVTGVSSEIMKHLGGKICGLLIAGAPGSGKTTLLRDLARSLSSGEFGQVYRVAVIDERGELAAAFAGCIQNDLGPSADVLSGCPKAAGILMAVRTLSPDIIILDEIGGAGEAEAVAQGLNAGVKIISSIHAGSKRELFTRRQFRELCAVGAFEKTALLYGREQPCGVREWIDMGELYDKAYRDFCGDNRGDRHRDDVFPYPFKAGGTA